MMSKDATTKTTTSTTLHHTSILVKTKTIFLMPAAPMKNGSQIHCQCLNTHTGSQRHMQVRRYQICNHEVHETVVTPGGKCGLSAHISKKTDVCMFSLQAPK